MTRSLTVSLALAALAASLSPAPAAGPARLVLPTDNEAIFSDDPSAFYMYTDRFFEGERSKPWSGGRYGLTRDQKRIDRGIVFTRFHEGVDIRPVRRDGSGEPLDDIYAIAAGTVVHVNASPGASNYGNYIVIEHQWGEGPVYSLYAHLKSAAVQPGQAVESRQVIGRMGYTGAGINKERSHLHLELALMLSSRFQEWFDLYFTTPNRHGNYNGINLAGIDIAAFYHALQDNPALTLAGFLSAETVYYRVRVNNRGALDLLRRYPWLGKGLAPGGFSDAPAWEISFNQHGIPLAIAPDEREFVKTEVSWVLPSPVSHAHNTSARLSGSGDAAALTDSGSRYIQLVTGAF